MSEPRSENAPPVDANRMVVFGHAERILHDALALLRTLTPEGWDSAYWHAVSHSGININDAAMLRDARLLAMRGGPRFKPEADYFGSSGGSDV